MIHVLSHQIWLQSAKNTDDIHGKTRTRRWPQD